MARKRNNDGPKFHVNFTIDWSLYNKLRDYSEYTDISMSSFVNKKMWEAVTKWENKERERIKGEKEED